MPIESSEIFQIKLGSIKDKIDKLELANSQQLKDEIERAINSYASSDKESIIELFNSESVLIAIGQAGDYISNVIRTIININKVLPVNGDVAMILARAGFFATQVSQALILLDITIGLQKLDRENIERIIEAGPLARLMAQQLLVAHEKDLLSKCGLNEYEMSYLLGLLANRTPQPVKAALQGLKNIDTRIAELKLDIKASVLKEIYYRVIEHREPNISNVISLFESREVLAKMQSTAHPEVLSKAIVNIANISDCVANQLILVDALDAAGERAESLSLVFKEMSRTESFTLRDPLVVNAIADAKAEADKLIKAISIIKTNFIQLTQDRFKEIIQELITAQYPVDRARELIEEGIKGLLLKCDLSEKEKARLFVLIESKDEQQIGLLYQGLQRIDERIAHLQLNIPAPVLKEIYCGIVEYDKQGFWQLVTLFHEQSILEEMQGSSDPINLSKAIANMVFVLTNMSSARIKLVAALSSVGEGAIDLSLIFKDINNTDADLLKGQKGSLIIDSLAKAQARGSASELRKALYMLRTCLMIKEDERTKEYIKELAQASSPVRIAVELIEERIKEVYQKYWTQGPEEREDHDELLYRTKQLPDKILALTNVTGALADKFDAVYSKLQKLLVGNEQEVKRISNIIYRRIFEQQGLLDVIYVFSNEHVLQAIITAGEQADELSRVFAKLKCHLSCFRDEELKAIVRIIAHSGTNAQDMVSLLNFLQQSLVILDEKTKRFVFEIKDSGRNAMVKAEEFLLSYVKEVLDNICSAFAQEKFVNQIIGSTDAVEILRNLALNKEIVKELISTLVRKDPEWDLPSEDTLSLLFDITINNVTLSRGKHEKNAVVNYAGTLSTILQGKSGEKLFIALKKYKKDDKVLPQRLKVLLSYHNRDWLNKEAFVETVLSVDETCIENLGQALDMFNRRENASLLLTDDVIRRLGNRKQEEVHKAAYITWSRALDVSLKRELEEQKLGRLSLNDKDKVLTAEESDKIKVLQSKVASICSSYPKKSILRSRAEGRASRTAMKIGFDNDVECDDDTTQSLPEINYPMKHKKHS